MLKNYILIIKIGMLFDKIQRSIAEMSNEKHRRILSLNHFNYVYLYLCLKCLNDTL